jgi:hypothetical protein
MSHVHYIPGSQDGNWGAGRRWLLQLCKFVCITADRCEEKLGRGWGGFVDRVLFQVLANCSLQLQPHLVTSGRLASGVPVMTSDLDAFHPFRRQAKPEVQVNVGKTFDVPVS